MIFLILCLMITLVFATIAIIALFTGKQDQRQNYMSKINNIGD